ncbi:hypothetical protein M0M57_00520 [Flavobacterium azooxidireducens]|uniref:Uncharacterized protein n=1 Tax=Flavobacterium azooxidireducens TaxID=1871076 RepID=A0ABY4KEU4_9FLAO|nr:hypothetical protein [Flavobacterium azooxidireducens]UPQ79338.1 hypothetical protein M0M57_00520 [Flavobacterium azooxidireducens]
MKQLIWKLILPLSLISFIIFRKWWYVFPVDGPESMMSGFPFPYVCDGWFTSMSNQFFLMEMIIDILVHFMFWFLLILFINRFAKIKMPKILTAVLMIFNVMILCCFIFIVTMPENVFKMKRDFDVEIKKTGYNFIWENTQRPKNEIDIERNIE